MNVWAQESTKSELRLKSYKGLNLQGLDYKIAKLRTEFILKIGDKLEFLENIGRSVQDF
jgi:hypothetical protein